MSEQQLAEAVAEALVQHNARLSGLHGCGDHSCLIAAPAVGTNGGCRCHHDEKKMRRVLASMFELQQALMTALRRRP